MRVWDKAVGFQPRWLLITIAAFAVAYVGWIAYKTADSGVDAGVGVLVAWPALLLLAALVIVPLVAVGVLVARVVRGGDRSDGESSSESITTSTFPM